MAGAGAAAIAGARLSSLGTSLAKYLMRRLRIRPGRIPLVDFNPSNTLTCFLARLHLQFVWHAQMFWRYARGRRNSYLSPGDLRIAYESKNFVVIDKAFDLSINTSSRWFNPLALNTQVFLARYWLADPTAYHWYRFCHQIDHATSGLILLAYSADAAKRASRAFTSRRVLKHYLAIVWGHFDSPDHVTIDQPIGWDRLDVGGDGEVRKHMVTERHYICLDPKPALSQLVPLERGFYDGEPATKVLLMLKHGRTHQLRVHTSFIQHPIVGDLKYSRRPADFDCHRMMLHAHRMYARLANFETIDCQAEDPFEPQCDPKWRSVEAQNDYAKFRNCCRVLETGQFLTADQL